MTLIPAYNQVSRILQRIRERERIPRINYQKMRTVVVMGHGVESDIKYLREIMGECTHLEKVVIFRYETESEESFNRKVVFFRGFCDNIQTEYYEEPEVF